MFKKIRNKIWLITYQVKEGKIIEVMFSARDGNLVGWCQKSLFQNKKDII